MIELCIMEIMRGSELSIAITKRAVQWRDYDDFVTAFRTA